MSPVGQERMDRYVRMEWQQTPHKSCAEYMVMYEIVETPVEVHSTVPQSWIPTPAIANGMKVSELTKGHMVKIEDDSEWARNMRVYFGKHLPDRKVVSFHELQFVKVCCVLCVVCCVSCVLCVFCVLCSMHLKCV